jgi:hypothetical protein
MTKELTVEYLKTILHYDPETNKWTWRQPISKRGKAGNMAGHVDRDGWHIIRINRQKYFGHRLAYFYMTGKWPEEEVDHKNRNPEDNRWSNLRKATHAETTWNTTKRTTNTSGYKGVSWHKLRHKWVANIKANGNRRYLGLFDTKEEAALAWNEAARRYHREFACLNEIIWPNGSPDDNQLRKVREYQQNWGHGKSIANKSGYRGVSWCKRTRKWQVSIHTKSKTIHLGQFDNRELAAWVYDEAAMKYHGEFASLNFPECLL